MAKSKSKTRYNFGYGAIYQRKTKNGKIRWYLDYRDGSGKRTQKVAPLAVAKEDAALALKEELARTFSKEYGIEHPEKTKISFIMFSEIYFQDYAVNVKKSWQADKSRLKTMVEYFKDTELQQITPLMIEKFRASRLKAGNSKGTCNRYLALLKRMFSIAIEEGYVTKNPVKKVKFFSEKDTLKERVLTNEEEERLLEASVEHLRSFLIIALNSGMRPGEIMSLKWNQIDFKSKTIRVEKTKSGRVRFIPINDDLLNELLKLQSKNGQTPYVFLNPETGKPLTSVKTSFKAACRRSGIKGLRLYDCRHTFASRLIQEGSDIETVRSLLGHHSVTMTQRYTHSNDKMKRLAVDSLSKNAGKRTQKGRNLLHICDTEQKSAEPRQSENPRSPLFSVN